MLNKEKIQLTVFWNSTISTNYYSPLIWGDMHKECQILNIKLLSISLIVLLSACGASQSPPYQKDRAPENRDQYSGAEGLTQQQKDQTYLMDKELSDKCTEAKIDLAIAEADKNATEIKKQSTLISSACI